MYLSAACLIGLRPLLSATSQWLKKRVVTVESRAPWRRTSSKISSKDDRDSMSHNLKEHVGGRARLESFDQDVECGGNGSISRTDIRMQSEIQVTSAERNMKGDAVNHPS